MTRILLLEDEQSLISGLSFALTKQGFEIEIARTMKEAGACWRKGRYNLLILDVSLPDGCGFDFCRMVRKESEVPIIFLTAYDEEMNIIMGLDIGGDDYITKPFSVRELKARVNRVFMRQEGKNSVSVLKAKNINYDIEKKEVKKDGEAVSLSSLELRILDLFAITIKQFPEMQSLTVSGRPREMMYTITPLLYT